LAEALPLPILSFQALPDHGMVLIFSFLFFKIKLKPSIPICSIKQMSIATTFFFVSNA
jgi:hypothetical protein